MQQSFRIDSSTYPLSYSYTDSGCGCPKADLRSVTYPDGMQVNYTRDSISRITGIASLNPAVNLLANVSYDAPDGSASNVWWGNGLQDIYSIDNKGRLSGIRLVGAGANDVSWNYRERGNGSGNGD